MESKYNVNGNIPVVLLPNVGEGGSVDNGDFGVVDPDFSVMPEVGPIYPDNTPGSLLPNPGEGGPVYPGRPVFPIIIPPIYPCYSCGSGGTGGSSTSRTSQVRFLNAAYGYQPFRVLINRRPVVNGLSFPGISGYARVADGYQTVTVAGPNGYIYLQKPLPFRSGELSTVAIVTTVSGLDLVQISDMPCDKPYNLSCFRACNLAYNTRPLDVAISDGRIIYSDVRFKEVTMFRRIRPGAYQFYIAETTLRPMPRSADIEQPNSRMIYQDVPNVLVSFDVSVRANAMYTVYILSRGSASGDVQTIVVEDRLGR